MYKSLTIINGGLIALMILSNGLMTEVLGNGPSVLLNHIIGLVTITLVMLITRTKWQFIKGIPILYLTAGVTGIMTVAFTNIAFLALGATVALMLSMFGRIVTSSVIDHFGLLGMRRYPFKPLKLVGLSMMMVGVVLIFIY